jgi:hypothetical protein
MMGFVVKCRYREQIGSCEPGSMHVIFRFAADHVHKCKVLQFAYASSLGCFQGAFSARSRKRSGGGALCLKTRVSEKLKFLPPCASAHCALAVAKACKTSQSKAFLRASSQTLGLGSFAAIEIPIFNRWCCRHRFVTML